MDYDHMFHIAKKVVDSIEKGVKPLIGWERSDEVVKIGADGTPTKRIDVIAENIAINSIERHCSAVLISEEIGIKKVGDGPPEYLIVLDPIDGTYNALNNLPIYSVSIAIGEIPRRNRDIDAIKSMDIRDLELGMVKNIATGEIYYGRANKGAYILEKNEKEWKRIKVSDTKNLKDASVGVFAYGLTTNTLNFIKDRKVRRIRIFGSAALEMCYVARGALDAFINVNETTRLCDIAGGYVILRESGGVITDRDGRPLNMRLDVKERTSLICSNRTLHRKLVGIFGNKWALKPTKFGIISRIDREEALDLVVQIIDYLESKGVGYLLEEELYKTLKDKMDIDRYDCKVMEDIREISHMLSIGGDGTVLRASRLIGGNEVPIISIDMGTVGFLTEFSRDEVFKAIDMVIRGNYEIERRTKCSCVVKFREEERKDYRQKVLPDALNEVVLITKSPAKMIHFEVYINGEFVEEVRADGIIVSTPTGSTAYSLSAGGPILEPSMDAFVVVPICPFKLFSRPIVVDGNSEILIRILRKSVLAVIDGNVEETLKKGDEVVLRKSDAYAYFVKGRKFYSKLKKLGN
ncbi:bifunctional NADP phosphatase/NAD kinase [Methanofervidicoccus sp. A16]|uniref:bifunctional NADP phosphatase/NAD kinase n=1 Tax=Methanofervidicoccus sp. A16 TaxID=2607662 RepID=UPI001188460E|nr:bifunctional NADP phosphatase/NAD kinase [Methanofervidicoccus sp. A16]AXI25746.1 bifunctional NADP phosphatase/NAD kinase [Methanofervidicoccus sp. A16]